MGKETEVYETYASASEHCTVDPWLFREKNKAKKDMQKAHAEKKVDSIARMVLIFHHLDDIWDRLSTLAYFWNAATQEERHRLFARL